MSASSLRTLRDAIKRRSFDGAYYILGDDDYQKDDAIRQLVEAALEPGTKDFNLDARRGSDIAVVDLACAKRWAIAAVSQRLRARMTVGTKLAHSRVTLVTNSQLPSWWFPWVGGG